MVGRSTILKGGGIHKDTNRCYGKVDRFVSYQLSAPDKKFPRSIIRIPKEHDSSQFHPTQKPVELIRWLIRTYSNPGDNILDACMGSGTTAIAAIRENRHFIGFELDNGYYTKSIERIRRECSMPQLF